METNFREELEHYIWGNAGGQFDWMSVQYTKDIILPNIEALPTLYRYVPADYYSIRNLEKQQIYLYDATQLNDLFEGVTACPDEKGDAILIPKDNVYIKSFSENKNDLIMWSHYADSFQGMCLQYDIKKIIRNYPNYAYHIFPVIYGDDRRFSAVPRWVITSERIVKRDREEMCYSSSDDVEALHDIIQYFMVKATPWQYEHEWRMIASYLHINHLDDDPIEEDTEEMYKLKSQTIDFPCCTAVRLGPRMVQQKKEHIIEICRRLQIPVYQMYMSKTAFVLEEKLI